MQKFITIVGLVLVLGMGCNGEPDGYVLHQEYLDPDSGEPFEGKRTWHYDTGDLEAEVYYVEGYPQTIVSYYPNQQKVSEILVGDKGKGDVKKQTAWYENGQKKFQSGEQVVKEWHENGELKAEVNYSENGELHGITKTWNEEGTLEEKQEYKNGSLVE